VWTEGDNAFGQLGLPPGQYRTVASVTESSGLRGSSEDPVVHLSCGAQHVAALTRGGQLLCAGLNDKGQLGLGSADYARHPHPTAVQLPGPATQVVCGAYFTVALVDGAVYTWGYDIYDQLGRDGDPYVPDMVSLPDKVMQIAAGWDFVAAVAGCDVLTWGRNNYGQLGVGTRVEQSRPARVKGLPEGIVPQVAAGAYHVLVLMGTELWVWGGGRSGELGNGVLGGQALPVRATFDVGPRGVLCLTAGYEHSAMVTKDGRLWLWGDSSEGKMGSADGGCKVVPTECTVLGKVLSVTCGARTTVVKAADGTSYVCGSKHGDKFVRVPVPTGCQTVARRFGGFDRDLLLFLKTDGLISPRLNPDSIHPPPFPRPHPCPAVFPSAPPPGPPPPTAPPLPLAAPAPVRGDSPSTHPDSRQPPKILRGGSGVSGGSRTDSQAGSESSHMSHHGVESDALSYPRSCYKAILEEARKDSRPGAPPDKEDIMMSAMETILHLAAQEQGTAPQSDMREFYKRLSRECESREAQPAEVMWASAEEVQVVGKERPFAWMVNHAIRRDDEELLKKVMPFCRGLDLFCARLRFGKKGPPIPWKDVLYRGSGLTPAAAKWYESMKGAKIRVAGFVATSADPEIADKHARKANMENFEPVKYYFAVDPVHRAWHVNYMSHHDGHDEWLFSPYSCFEITSVKLKSCPTWTTAPGHEGPHEISVKVSVDNDIEDMDLPIAPWM